MTKAKMLALLDELETNLKHIAELEKEKDYPYLYGYLLQSVKDTIARTEGDYLSPKYVEKRKEIERWFEE